jgi:hypothetical protein
MLALGWHGSDGKDVVSRGSRTQFDPKDWNDVAGDSVYGKIKAGMTPKPMHWYANRVLDAERSFQTAKNHPQFEQWQHDFTSKYGEDTYLTADQGPNVERFDEYQVLMPTHQKWEDMSKEQQKRVQEHFKDFGINSFEEGVNRFGAQLDHAFLRADEHGVDLPLAAHFYHTGGAEVASARQQLHQTAQEFTAAYGKHVPYHAVALAHAITSAGAPFDEVRTNAETGGRYNLPTNDDAARHVLHHALMGTPIDQVPNAPMRNGVDVLGVRFTPYARYSTVSLFVMQ